MSEHLSLTVLSALADGELSADQMGSLKEHLDRCPACTAQALTNALLKTATARAGQRHAIPPEFQQNMKRFIAREPETAGARYGSRAIRWNWVGITGWAAAVVLLAILLAPVELKFGFGRSGARSGEQAALISEVTDLHISTLAANQPPEVLSSDRHTVKPWFEGKIPFSFNLPDDLPAGVELDGANLAYLDNQPVAQLLYSIGRHRASVFICQRGGDAGRNALPEEHAGFQIAAFRTQELGVVAISDVDRGRLLELMAAIERAQVNASTAGQARP